jgi:hypothetical protein
MDSPRDGSTFRQELSKVEASFDGFVESRSQDGLETKLICNGDTSDERAE